jgi:hypothetical protein
MRPVPVRTKPLCRVCRTNRLWQKWDVIDRARIRHETMPVCSAICRRIAAARELARGRKTPLVDDQPAPPHPRRRRIFPEFAGEGILRIVDRPDWEARRAEEVSANRAAAAEWMA